MKDTCGPVTRKPPVVEIPFAVRSLNGLARVGMTLDPNIHLILADNVPGKKRLKGGTGSRNLLNVVRLYRILVDLEVKCNVQEHIFTHDPRVSPQR